MTTLFALMLFAALLGAASQLRRVSFLRKATAHGWTVEPWRITKVSVGPSITRTHDGLRVRVSLPLIDAENQGNWLSRWSLSVEPMEGGLAAVPGEGVAFARQATRKRLLVPKALRGREDVPALPRVRIRAVRDEDVTTLLRDADVLASLQSCFRDGSPVEELLLTRPALRMRALRSHWTFEELDGVTAHAIEIAESCAEPS